MTICHERKLIFIHIPKNAGTSIIKAMGIEEFFLIKLLKNIKKTMANIGISTKSLQWFVIRLIDLSLHINMQE